jgi:hypothetical protein
LNKYRVTACKSSYQLCRFAEQSNFDKKCSEISTIKEDYLMILNLDFFFLNRDFFFLLLDFLFVVKKWHFLYREVALFGYESATFWVQ